MDNNIIVEYLSKKIDNFQKTSKKGVFLFSCPQIKQQHYYDKKSPTAFFINGTNKIHCPICEWKGTIYDVVRLLEPEKKNCSDAEITDYLIHSLHAPVYKELDEYEKYGWALVPLLQNDKKPFEKGWTDIVYKDKIKWIKWLNNNLNIGCRCGEVSGMTGIDVDLKVAPTGQVDEIYKLLKALNTLEQDTPHGKHFIVKYDKELYQTTNIGGLHIDIRNDGGQIVIAPSKIDSCSYKWTNLGTEIKSISPELKAKLLEYIKVNKGRNDNIISPEKPVISEKITTLKEGEGRNNTLVQIGGALINKFNPDDTAYILSLISNKFFTPPLPFHEIKAMLGSLQGYKLNEEQSYEQAIYNFLKIMQTDVTMDDINKGVFNNDKTKSQIIYKYLSQFVKQGKAIRLGRGRYQYKETIEWSDATPEIIDEYKYNIPLFNNVAIFQDADCLILGGRANDGKTTIALNILKGMIEQGVKPYYIYNEAGSRFQKTAKILGIEGKFYHCQHSNPLAVELVENSFTIIDWLCLENKAETDVTLKHLNDELQRKRGILVIFTQLKKDCEWFAPNLIDHFPTFAARYIQENTEKTQGHWECDKIKEPRGNWTIFSLPCIYDHSTRIFQVKDLIN